MRSDEILAQIDDTLDDWAVSDDAMRSRPADEASAEPFQMGGIVPVVQIMDEAGEWQEASGITSIDFHIEPPEIDPDFQRSWQQMQEYFARAQAERMRRAEEALEAFARALTVAVKPAADQALRDLAQAAQAFQQLQEAADCPPPPRSRDRPPWQSPYGPPQRRR